MSLFDQPQLDCFASTVSQKWHLKFFCKKDPQNTSKFACQAPKPLNPLPINNICTKESFPQSAIIELEGKKSRKPGQKGQGFLF
jgi:hypothetical protein